MTEHIAGFIQYLIDEKKSNNTVQSYSRDLNAYAAYIKENNLDFRDGLESYTQYLYDSGKTKATVSRFLSSVKRFCSIWSFRAII